MKRRVSRQVSAGNVKIGGSANVSIQSMTNTDTRDVAATVEQILELEQAGCDIVRTSVYDEACATAIREIKKEIHIPLVADIHFDHRLALLAVENGIDKLRINPGNIAKEEHVREMVAACRERGIPIRIGVNSGSLSKSMLERFGGVTAEAIVESALGHVAILERCGFEDIVISVKASDVLLTLESYRQIAQRVDYPLHLGVTEAGTRRAGVVKSAIGIGALLAEGIGDTIRVSLTGPVVPEVIAAKDILRSLKLYQHGLDITSCPTCGRCKLPLEDIVSAVEAQTGDIETPLHVAIMGCIVNGPGEAREADIGLAGGDGAAAIFRGGQLLRTVRQAEMVDELVREIRILAEEKSQ